MSERDPGRPAGVLHVCAVARLGEGYAPGMGKLMAAVVFAIGYVLGARAGRERYDEIRRAVGKVMADPRIKEIVIKVENRALNHYNDAPPSANGSAPRRNGVAT